MVLLKGDIILNKFNSKNLLTQKGFVVSIAIFCSLLWGSAFPVLKVSYAQLGMAPNDLSAKLVFAGMRFFLASLMLIIMMLFINKKALKISKHSLGPIIALGVVSTTLQYFFFYNGLAHTSGIKGAILASSGTFFIVLIAHFIYTNDKLDWKKGVGLVTGFAGIVFVNWGQSMTLDFHFMGAGFLILAGLVNAIGTVMAKKLSIDVHPFALTGWQLFIGSSILLVIGLPLLRSGAMTFTPLAWGLLFYSAFLSATAFALWFSLLKYNKAGEISIFKFVIPVAGTVLSALVIPGENFSLSMAGALILVAVGIFAVNYRTRPRKTRLFLKDGSSSKTGM